MNQSRFIEMIIKKNDFSTNHGLTPSQGYQISPKSVPYPNKKHVQKYKPLHKCEKTC